MVVLGGGVVSYERGTLVVQHTDYLPEALDAGEAEFWETLELSRALALSKVVQPTSCLTWDPHTCLVLATPALGRLVLSQLKAQGPSRICYKSKVAGEEQEEEESETRIMNPETLNPKPQFPIPKPSTLNPNLNTLDRVNTKKQTPNSTLGGSNLYKTEIRNPEP